MESRNVLAVITISLLGAVAIAGSVGSFILALFGKETPLLLGHLSTAAMGALAAILVRVPHMTMSSSTRTGEASSGPFPVVTRSDISDR